MDKFRHPTSRPRLLLGILGCIWDSFIKNIKKNLKIIFCFKDLSKKNYYYNLNENIKFIYF